MADYQALSQYIVQKRKSKYAYPRGTMVTIRNYSTFFDRRQGFVSIVFELKIIFNKTMIAFFLILRFVIISV